MHDMIRWCSRAAPPPFRPCCSYPCPHAELAGPGADGCGAGRRQVSMGPRSCRRGVACMGFALHAGKSVGVAAHGGMRFSFLRGGGGGLFPTSRKAYRARPPTRPPAGWLHRPRPRRMASRRASCWCRPTSSSRKRRSAARAGRGRAPAAASAKAPPQQRPTVRRASRFAPPTTCLPQTRHGHRGRAAIPSRRPATLAAGVSPTRALHPNVAPVHQDLAVVDAAACVGMPSSCRPHTRAGMHDRAPKR